MNLINIIKSSTLNNAMQNRLNFPAISGMELSSYVIGQFWSI